MVRFALYNFMIRSFFFALLVNATIIATLAASAQIAFYLETGSEISWSAGTNIAAEWDGIRLLLSGSTSTALCTISIIALSAVTKKRLYDLVGASLRWIWSGLRNRQCAVQDGLHELGSEWSEKCHEKAEQGTTPCAARAPRPVSRLHRLLVLGVLISALLSQICRPRTPPLASLSDSLLVAVLESLSTPHNRYCDAVPVDYTHAFPFPEKLVMDAGTTAAKPAVVWSSSAQSSSQVRNSSGYAPSERSKILSDVSDTDSYSPELDPLRISNLGHEVLSSVLSSIGAARTKIKHVVLLTFESTRADVFPLTTDSHLYETILASYQVSPGYNHTSLARRLAGISPVAELLTGSGEASGFSQFRTNPSAGVAGSWRARLSERPSSINVLGATTGSSTSLKSLINSHCGVHALPVEFTEEATRIAYQPCLSHILDLFNHNKASSTRAPVQSMHDSPWTSAFVQSSTDRFDRQQDLNAMMGFKPENVFAKANLTEKRSRYYPPNQSETNYFGFPDSAVKPYLQDLFRETRSSGRRLFLSHFTSQTHHPFKLPPSFGTDEEYLHASHLGKESILNGYLNTIRYADTWLGEIMDMLDEAGMTNETLVVMVGDHGMTFSEDVSNPSSYENPHIANFRVPLAFQHPSLPPLQMNVSATSIQILPTILDLLLASGSLSASDTKIAEALLPQYQGQSLIRPLKTSEHGREVWMPAIVTLGGSTMTIGSAASPYRLALPLCNSSEYRFTDLSRDPNELAPTTAWSMEVLLKKISVSYRRHGTNTEQRNPVEWTRDAEKIARWWSWEMRRLWKYGGAAQHAQRPKGDRKAGQICRRC
ncbi:hypothetical protein ANO11243_066790 [Dothideomycetidae sp. 11243]|nr:hypothetical protein ANO11243_066790 [fungal sp. No.11243]